MRRAEEEQLPEPRREVGAAVAAIDDAVDEHVRPHPPDVAEHLVPGAGPAGDDALVHQVSEMAEAAHHEHLVIISHAQVQVIGRDGLPLGRDPAEPERHAQLTSAVHETAACLVDLVRGAEAGLGQVDAGDPDLRRAAVPGGEAAQQARPLEAISDAVVDDVQAAAPGHGVEDGLVGEGEGHLLAAAGGHEELVGLEEVDGGGGLEHERVVQAAARAGEARLQALGEAVRQPLRGVAGGRGVAPDLRQQVLRAAPVVRGHGLRAPEQQCVQVHRLVVVGAVGVGGAAPPPPRRRLVVGRVGDDALLLLLHALHGDVALAEHHLVEHLTGVGCV
ncbi:hypothetical protein SETIT_8G250100v2 [Setaria italica]|uniref:Uncharacterized protein n=1 Tax=Setaria italica TaxID=4555 RepID=A0A368SBP1_SETIT|nr:hypothetical protein SETIT_8G250100v2 [Setaria italica]